MIIIMVGPLDTTTTTTTTTTRPRKPQTPRTGRKEPVNKNPVKEEEKHDHHHHGHDDHHHGGSSRYHAFHSFHYDPGDGRRNRNGKKRTGRSIDFDEEQIRKAKNTTGSARLARHIRVISPTTHFIVFTMTP